MSGAGSEGTVASPRRTKPRRTEADEAQASAAEPGAPECERCAALEAELAEARAERDAAKLELARARELADALRLSFPPTGEPPPPPFAPAMTPGAPPPLRYVLADRANDYVKRYLQPLHSAGRRAAEAASRLLTRSR